MDFHGEQRIGIVWLVEFKEEPFPKKRKKGRQWATGFIKLARFSKSKPPRASTKENKWRDPSEGFWFASKNPAKAWRESRTSANQRCCGETPSISGLCSEHPRRGGSLQSRWHSTISVRKGYNYTELGELCCLNLLTPNWLPFPRLQLFVAWILANVRYRTGPGVNAAEDDGQIADCGCWQFRETSVQSVSLIGCVGYLYAKGNHVVTMTSVQCSNNLCSY